VLPVVKKLVKEFPEINLSIDTFRSNVAARCIDEGAALINDISAGSLDLAMFETVAKLQVPYIMMHMQGTPQTMQQNPSYDNIIKEIIYFFSKKLAELRSLGVNDIIADVGFGFGKTMTHNYSLLRDLALFNSLEVPLLAGISRKSMLYKLLEIKPKTSLNATTCANTIALLNGANILRVHDVKEAVEAIKIVAALQKN
jgi:dihydropteroate synthase